MSNSRLIFEIVPSDFSQYASPVITYIQDTVIKEIPKTYISWVEVEFKNGISITLSNEEIKNSLYFTSKDSSFNQNLEILSSVKIYLDLDRIEKDIDNKIDKLIDGIISPSKD